MVRGLVLTFVLLVSIFGDAQFGDDQERLTPTLKGEGKPAAMPRPSPSLIGAGKRLTGADDVERVETNLVTVPVSVRDRVGRYITDLRKEDFQIFEDGVEQEVAVFAPVEQPFTTLLLLDVSGSMTYKMEDLAHAANTFVGQLRPDDQLIAASFDDWVKVVVDATKVSDLPKSIKLRSSGKGTLLYDAVDYALKRMSKIRGRKAIVLFSDGMGEGIFATSKGNLHKAEEHDALIYTVQFNTYPTILPPRFGGGKKQYYEGLEAANSYMRDLARKTGGRHYQVESLSDLGKTFSLVADELRRQYSLGYYPKQQLEAGQRRKIKVEMHVPNLAVQARDSYLVDKARARGK